MRAAHRELEAARRDWARAFRNVRSTLRYEDLIPAAQKLDQAFKRFIKASKPFMRST